MNYHDLRNKIQDGDFVFFKAESLKQRFICWFTGGVHSHCGIANWLTDNHGVQRLMLIESFVGGCRMVTMSSYDSRPMDVIRIDGLKWSELSEFVTSKTGTIKYGMFDFVTIGLRDLSVRLGLGKKWLKEVPDTSGQVCSEMLADVLNKVYPIETTLLSPAGLFDLIRKKNFGLPVL